VWHPPPESLALPPDEVHVWCASLDRSAAGLEQLRQTLSEDERRRAERFCFAKDRAHFTAARGLLRLILGRYLGREPCRLTFCYSAHGKPALGADCGGDALRFNLAHSRGLALYALTRGRDLGVDVERVREEVQVEQIWERFFSAQEIAALRALPAALRRQGFFTCWARKEAYIKAVGKGLAIPLDAFDVSLAPGEPAALLAVRFDSREATRWSLRELTPSPGFVGALAVEGHAWRLWCGRWPD
jgi:4'-phosphopantetheinyl transferase